MPGREILAGIVSLYPRADGHGARPEHLLRRLIMLDRSSTVKARFRRLLNYSSWAVNAVSTHDSVAKMRRSTLPRAVQPHPRYEAPRQCPGVGGHPSRSLLLPARFRGFSGDLAATLGRELGCSRRPTLLPAESSQCHSGRVLLRLDASHQSELAGRRIGRRLLGLATRLPAR